MTVKYLTESGGVPYYKYAVRVHMFGEAKGWWYWNSYKTGMKFKSMYSKINYLVEDGYTVNHYIVSETKSCNYLNSS